MKSRFGQFFLTSLMIILRFTIPNGIEITTCPIVVDSRLKYGIMDPVSVNKRDLFAGNIHAKG